jgi:hypothetical protein
MTSSHSTPKPKPNNIEELTNKIASLKLGYQKDDHIHTVRSKITKISKGSRRTKFEVEGRKRCYWFIGNTDLKVGDYVEIRYQLVLVGQYRQAWILDITELKEIS